MSVLKNWKINIKYRSILFSNGFLEAKNKKGNFFRQSTEKAAFVVNLEHNNKNGFTILYGFASTTCTAGDEEWFANNGSDRDDCQLRNIIYICDENSELRAKNIITDFYERYKNFSKDEILTLKKERQNSFLANFAEPLKALGFKKKGTKWSKVLNNGNELIFHAQKSAFSDQYYFNVNLYDTLKQDNQISHERVVLNGNAIYNWQLMTTEEIKNLVLHTLDNYIKPYLK